KGILGRAEYLKSLPARKCVWTECRAWFSPYHAVQKFCSETCRLAERRRTRALEYSRKMALKRAESRSVA
ncbi:MAG TPA: hypothetical protein VLK82_12475, partial [Candidatus Tectomicrobia bacterium]|nr:hypothetical protein [Candidatus Tectomicrobia bacterium]